MHLERLAPADGGVAIALDRVEEAGDQRLVGLVRKRHRVGAAAAAAGARALDALDAAVLPEYLQGLDRQHRRRVLAGELDALGKARERHRGGVDRADGAV